MRQSPAPDFTPSRTSRNASLPDGVLFSSSAPRSRQLRQRPLVRRETVWHAPQISGSARIANVGSAGGSRFMGSTRLRTQSRAEITDLVVDVRLRFHRPCH